VSRIDETIEERRDRTSPLARDIAGVLRWFAITLTSGPTWQVIGHLLIDGLTRETRSAAVFSGIGFYSRPKAGTNREAIVANIAGAENPVIIATRDEDTRARVADIDEDETMAYNTVVGVLLRKDNKILACMHGGTPVELAKASELNSLRAFVAAQFAAVGHSHTVVGGATTATAALGAVPTTSYPGTQVFKAE
jgi:phage gp45-like